MIFVHGAIILLISLAYINECKNPNILVAPIDDDIASYVVHLKYARPKFDKKIRLDESAKREMCEGLLDSVTYEVLENEDYTTYISSIASFAGSIWPSAKSSIPTKNVKFQLKDVKGRIKNTEMPAMACFVVRGKEWVLIPIFNSTSPPHHLVLRKHTFSKTHFQLYGIYHKMDHVYVPEGKVKNPTADDCFSISQSKLELMYEDGIEIESSAFKIYDKTHGGKFSALNKFQRNFLCSLSHGAYSNATQKNFRLSLSRIRFVTKFDKFSFPLGTLMMGGKPKHSIKIMACGLYANSIKQTPENFYLAANLKDHSQIFVVEHINGTGNDRVYELVAAVKGPNIEHIMSH